MSNDKRYMDLAQRLEQSVEATSDDKPSKRPYRRKGASPVNPNPPKGTKGDNFKVTIMFSPDVYELVTKELARRRALKERNITASAIVREALVAMLQKGGITE